MHRYRMDEKPHPAEIHIRAAQPPDLPEMLKLTFSGLGETELAAGVTANDTHPFHVHASSNGRVLVAELRSEIVGYASVIERNRTRILSQLFVLEEIQSRGIGKLLFDRIDPVDGTERLLLASDDMRAVALYIRSGYVPAWPVYSLQIGAEMLASFRDHGLTSRPAVVDERFVEFEAGVSQRLRQQDLTFWLDSTGAMPYLHYKDEQLVGFGWISDPLTGGMARWLEDDSTLHVGPIGAVSIGDSIDCVAATLELVGELFPGRDATVEIGGPHPALPRLLRSGARITNAELAMATNIRILGDPERYVPSGGILL